MFDIIRWASLLCAACQLATGRSVSLTGLVLVFLAVCSRPQPASDVTVFALCSDRRLRWAVNRSE